MTSNVRIQLRSSKPYELHAFYAKYPYLILENSIKEINIPIHPSPKKSIPSLSFLSNPAQTLFYKFSHPRPFPFWDGVTFGMYIQNTIQQIRQHGQHLRRTGSR